MKKKSRKKHGANERNVEPARSHVWLPSPPYLGERALPLDFLFAEGRRNRYRRYIFPRRASGRELMQRPGRSGLISVWSLLALGLIARGRAQAQEIAPVPQLVQPFPQATPVAYV